MKDLYVVNCCRTAIGSFGGSLKNTPAAEMGAVVVKEALKRANIAPENVDEVMFGCILTAAQGQNVARQVAIKAGIPYSVPAYTVGMVCGSGMKSVIEGARSILAGDSDVVVCGGTENMSAAPFASMDARWGARMGDKKLVDKYKMPDAENAFESNTENGGIEMDSLPETAEPLANVKFQVTKMEQDQAGKWNETTVSRTVVTNESGEAVLEDLPLGRYKVEELGLDSSDGSDAVLPNEKDDAMVGKAFYVDVPMTQADGQTLNYNVHVYPKNEVLSIEKDVTYVGNKHDSFDMQENQTWIIHTAIPGNIALTNDNGSYDTAKLYKVTDKIDSQLTYKGNIVVKAVDKDYKTVIDELEKDTDYSVEEPAEGNENTLIISLTDAGKIKLKKAINNPDAQAAFLQIRFDTMINKTAKTGEAIYNDADLKFTTAKGTAVDVSVPENERPEVHTGKIAIKKVGEKADGTPLKDVEFMIFDSTEKAQAAVKLLQNNKAGEITGALKVYDPNQKEFTTVVKTNDKGVAEFRGLAYYTNKANEENKVQGDDAATGAKKYYLVETKTVKGYQLPSKYFEVTVNHDSSTATVPSDTIINTKPSKLPAAGGNGTIIFTAVGLTVMAAAGIIIFMSRKKKDR